MPKFELQISEWLKGNASACAFAISLFNALHFWDDLIDNDNHPSSSKINSAMWDLLIEIPSNPFYQANFSALQPIIKMGIINWHTANTIEVSDDEKLKRYSFVMRSVITDYIAASALIIGGLEWAKHVHMEMLLANEETFEQYCESLKKEKRER